jgi:homogentisate 1,2-dioxygenase
VICSFVPRPFDFDPESVKVPYHHANVDSDEVLFYAAGEFKSRRGAGIQAGSLTLHPAGFVHGPQPGSVEAVVDATHTDETAVMIDTFAPLQLSAVGRAVADANYPWSWARPLN